MASLTDEQLEQLASFLSDIVECGEEEAAPKAFELVDLDHDARVTREEIEGVFTRLSEGLDDRARAVLDRAFESADANHDGALDVKEFVNFLRSLDSQIGSDS
mmetsp:Transcript_26826/g.48346  ORF Transcript_26826/g.48346 Transcript_26826/m.48346 type:complete len:103 (+) Transcript_26826:174-482(+)|eukprot:CAMPEP_0204918598 /NCGR_PEP_ID=MMETSP1397-20131031/16255_1 /ASSEMBLY_ACC=CAM_ASM_000891 /TAXON_ID=49980 /ORGANISM="Climacostomum Climacostomum virens, Strain Stock W-24" /LENGTH=102 /DNA_ID=CAMNT_0052091929 /DNA_START=168 /DNA_END=476 /DNA_ORIENTATION=-